MKQITLILFSLFLFTNSFSQTDTYNLASQNLHKNVRKTIEHSYYYDKESGGFVKSAVSIKNYDDNERLIETYYVYYSKYNEPRPIKKLYNYNRNGKLISTTDISDNKNNYSSNQSFIYDKKGNLIKTELNYNDGSKSYTVYVNDKKGRVVNTKQYSKAGKVLFEIITSYKGNKKTESKTSYSFSDGSIIGNYETVYVDDIKTKYTSNSKYGNSTTTYNYDKQGNQIKSVSKGKSNLVSNYNYVYDKKDNWIKYHSRSGKYQYFYFREIYFKNGDVTGSTNFDKIFINKHGNFDNVNVVPLKKKKTTKPKKPEYQTIVDNTMPAFSSRNWKFDTVKIGEKSSALSGTATLKVLNDTKMQIGAEVDIKLFFNNQETPLSLTVTNYTSNDKTHFWTFEDPVKEKVRLSIFKEKIGDIDAVLTVGKDDKKTMIFFK